MPLSWLSRPPRARQAGESVEEYARVWQAFSEWRRLKHARGEPGDVQEAWDRFLRIEARRVRK